MINPANLLKDLQRLLPKIEQDILSYSETQVSITTYLDDEYAKAIAAKRTAEHFVDWRASQITQSAVAWVLTSVFVRFLEDNKLLDDPMIAGPAGERMQHAKDQLTVYFNDNPTHGEREYLLNRFERLEQFPAMGELLDRRHNPLWQIPVSADGAKHLMDFFQSLNPESGVVLHDFTDDNWDTRFLGDLYQDLSESVRKRYALLQTPEFVESFILDYTLERALDTFGLEGLRLIDPTCGSGHFVLTAFDRLFEAWIRREPGTNARALAQRALDSVFGVDINPYAVSVARFRLLIAAMRAAGSDKLAQAPDFQFNLAVGDSLLHGKRHESIGGVQIDALNDELAHVFDVEDRNKLDKILGQQYHAVVGNPPYIVVKDKALNIAYRARYGTCHRQYSLGVPFTERFFDLTLAAEGNHPAGYMGMITTNSFMKREFGKKLIEEYFPNKELTHVIDTSKAYIPGHGTPTVILFGRNQFPKSNILRAVLGIRGEPVTPKNAAEGKVWQSVVNLIENPKSENDYVSVLDQERELYKAHPWSVSGGGASELKELIENTESSLLGSIVLAIGFVCITKQDDVFVQERKVLTRSRIKDDESRAFGVGEEVRDWSHSSSLGAIFPYNDNLSVWSESNISPSIRFMWPYREDLYSRKVFGGLSYREAGKTWYEYGQIPVERFKIPSSITFASVATHNNFVFDRGGKVFKQSAPVIKLSTDATVRDHISLLGFLNSSVACFWMKQVFHNKGGGGIGGGLATEAWEQFYDHAGTSLKGFPVVADPKREVLALAQQLDQLAQQQSQFDPENILKITNQPIKASLDAANAGAESLTAQMIALQEELDWLNYRLYGLTDENLCYQGSLPEIRLGERSFEIHLARRIANGDTETTWFQRHSSNPIVNIPIYWADDYQALIQRRLDVIEENRWIKLVEQPEYKRRWNQESWDKRQQRALKEWLLEHLEAQTHAPELQTCAQLADQVRNDLTFQQVASLYTGRDTYDVQTLVSELIASDEIPQMAAARYKPKAMKKFRAWQETWHKQREEDVIDARKDLDTDDEQYLNEIAANKLKANIIGDIPLPPKYASSDFRKPSYWPLRGKLDVPKERFFSLPGCEKTGDNTLVIGWAGLNHLQRAQAIAAWYLDRKESEGWSAEQLKPMLVALDELCPWLKQWHNDIDPEFGERLGDYYEGFLLEELRTLELSRDELNDWEPPVIKRSGGRRKKTS